MVAAGVVAAVVAAPGGVAVLRRVAGATTPRPLQRLRVCEGDGAAAAAAAAAVVTAPAAAVVRQAVGRPGDRLYRALSVARGPDPGPLFFRCRTCPKVVLSVTYATVGGFVCYIDPY